jgi:hypothetical protein
VGGVYLTAVNLTNDPPAYVYADIGKQSWMALGLGYFSHPCWREEQTEFGPVMHSLPTDECFRMTEPRRMKGVWIDEFEGSRFVPGARDTTGVEVEPFGIWLNVHTNRIAGLVEEPHELRAFEVEFIGRQTLYRGSYGHMGMSEHEVIMDELIWARPVDVSPYAKKLEEWMRSFSGQSPAADGQNSGAGASEGGGAR